MKTPHTSCRKGTTVWIKLRDGTVIVDKFVERTGKFVITENHKLKSKVIRAFSIRKHKCS